MSPTPRVAITLALAAVGAVLLGPAAGGAIGLALVAATAVDARVARRAPAVRRTLPGVLARGAGTRLVVEVEAPWARHVVVRQPLPTALTAEPPTAAGGLRAALTPVRRGRHRVGPAAIRVTGPLGLARWDHEGGGEAEVLVHPDVPAARRLALAARRGRFGEAGRLVRGPLGLGTDFESVRDYLPDDDVRQINWAATARLQRPMSNQYRVEQDREVVCLVDCGRLMSAPLRDRTRLDAAVDAATAVGLVADELDDRCGVIAFDDRVLRHLRPRRRGGRALVRALFDVEAAAVDADYEAAFRRVGAGKRALVLVLTDFVDETAATAMVGAVPVLARHHEVVVATARDPDLHDALRRRPHTTTDVYQAAVALDVLARRDRAAARVRASGARVVEAPAARLGAACVEAYLRAKARARL